MSHCLNNVTNPSIPNPTSFRNPWKPLILQQQTIAYKSSMIKLTKPLSVSNSHTPQNHNEFTPPYTFSLISCYFFFTYSMTHIASTWRSNLENACAADTPFILTRLRVAPWLLQHSYSARRSLNSWHAHIPLHLWFGILKNNAHQHGKKRQPQAQKKVLDTCFNK